MEKQTIDTARRGRGFPGGRQLVGLPVLAACAIALAACGGGSSTTSATTKTGGAAPTTGPAATGGRTIPGAFGTLAAIDGTSLEVQNPESGQTTVTYTPTTAFSQTVTASLADVTVGSCISAFGKPPSGSTSSTSSSATPATVTATTVTITPASSTGCTRSGAGRGGFAGFDRKRPAGFDGKPPAAVHFPKGSHKGFAGFGGAFGTVTAVSGSTVTVQETNPSTKKVESVTVTVTSSTRFSQTEAATPSALAVGQCVRAIGPANDTGAVTASSISLSTAGPDGCSAGFGFGGVGGGSGGGATGGGGASDA